jgi:hypothetical protein
MKHLIKFSFLIIFLSIPLASCKKLNLEKEQLEYLIGDYDFVYGQNSEIDIITSNELPDNYGIRIEKKYISFYKNGERTSRTYFLNECPHNATCANLYLRYKPNEIAYSLFWKGDTIWTVFDPLKGEDEQLLKTCYYIKK